MKVLLYSSTSRTREGGVQGVYASLAAGLRRRGHHVVEAWSAPASPPRRAERTVPLHLPRTWHGLPRPASLFASGQSAARLLRDLGRVRPDVVHVHFVRFEAAYFVALRRLLGYRVVLTFHGSDLYRPDPTSARVLPTLARRADAVTAVSAPIRDGLRDRTGARASLVPNGVDVDFWSAAGPPSAPFPTIVAAGRLEPVKGLDVLIEAVRRLRETRDVRLRLIGDGRQRRALERQATEAGLDEAVTFTGRLDAEGVRAAFRSASVFALPSRSEGMPLAVLEALAAGLPVVAARVGGVPDLVTPDVGALVEPGDPAALADALGAYLSAPDRARRAGRAGATAAQVYSTEAMVDAYAALYDGLLVGRRAAEPRRAAA